MARTARPPRKRHTLEPRPVDTDVWTLARERCAEVFDRFDQVAVSFSGGKDSTATLHAALETLAENPGRWPQHEPLHVIFYDEEAIPYETEQYVRRVAERDDVRLDWYCLPVQHRNACARSEPFWWPWAPEARDRWTRPLPPEAITEIPGVLDWSTPPAERKGVPLLSPYLFDPSRGIGCLMLGIRAQESLSRLRMVTRRSVDNWLITVSGPGQPSFCKAYPVYDWTTEDVWTAPAVFGWDYNRAYDQMEMMGIPHAQQRCSPAFGEEPLQKLHTYAACFPDVWARMTDRVPGVGAAARYARTELYGYGSIPEPPAGSTWPEHSRHYVEQFGDYSPKVAYRVREEVKRHYNLTSQPLAPTAEHPLTGCCWRFLTMVAMRGDFKKRKNAATKIKTVAADRDWLAYVDQLVSVYAQFDNDLVAVARYLGHPGRLAANPTDYLPEHLRESVTL